MEANPKNTIDSIMPRNNRHYFHRYWNSYYAYAVTLDMVNAGCVNQFMNAFDVYPRPKCLTDMATDYMDIVFYDTDMNPLYQEENDDD